MSVIKLEKNQSTTLLTIDRPEVHNALNSQCLDELCALAENLYQDRTTRVVIITGAKGKSFCAGADLKERGTFTTEQVRQFVQKISHTFTMIATLPQPVIAAVNGVAFGGGMELTLACDFRIAEEQAYFGLTEVSLGIIPGAGGTQRLPRLIGLAQAKELILTAKRINATEAERLGLLNQVVPTGTAVDAALVMAERLCKLAPLSLAQAKTAIDQGIDLDLKSGLKTEYAAYETLISTRDRLEGLRAFQEKREPVYMGE